MNKNRLSARVGHPEDKSPHFGSGKTFWRVGLALTPGPSPSDVPLRGNWGEGRKALRRERGGLFFRPSPACPSGQGDRERVVAKQPGEGQTLPTARKFCQTPSRNLRAVDVDSERAGDTIK